MAAIVVLLFVLELGKSRLGGTELKGDASWTQKTRVNQTMDAFPLTVMQPENIGASSVRFRPRMDNGRALTFSEAIRLFRDTEKDGSAFRSAFVSALRTAIVSLQSEVYLECRPTASRNRDTDPFEFSVVRAADLDFAARSPDPSDFSQHFQHTSTFATFYNLGRDALLVSSRPLGSESFGTLRSFLTHAPPALAEDLWRAVGDAVLFADADPLWLSTSGAGVAWLHVRLDSRPKYYKTREYLTYVDTREDAGLSGK